MFILNTERTIQKNDEENRLTILELHYNYDLKPPSRYIICTVAYFFLAKMMKCKT